MQKTLQSRPSLNNADAEVLFCCSVLLCLSECKGGCKEGSIEQIRTACRTLRLNGAQLGGTRVAAVPDAEACRNVRQRIRRAFSCSEKGLSTWLALR